MRLFFSDFLIRSNKGKQLSFDLGAHRCASLGLPRVKAVQLLNF